MSNHVLPVGILTACACGALVACDNPNAEARLAALALNNAAIACVDDVKTVKVKYDTSAKCLALGPLAQNYADVGGLTAKTPNDFEAIYERVRVYAWMARAISASGEPEQSIFTIR